METYSNHFYKLSTKYQPYFNLTFTPQVVTNWELLISFNATQKNNAFQWGK